MKKAKGWLAVLFLFVSLFGLVTHTEATQMKGNTSFKKYVTVTKSNYNVWNNFNWVKKTDTKQLFNQTYYAKIYYTHPNNTDRYYSLYDTNNKWMGYLNTTATKTASGAQGIALNENTYVTVTKKNYNIYSNFSWKKKNTTNNLYQKTYLAKVKYNHANKSTYYSLYDSKNIWLGYVNASATTKASGAQGKAFGMNQYVTLVKNNYQIYQDFKWTKKNSTTNLLNKTYLVKTQYHHFNGSTYFSLYDAANQWMGYVNAGATQKASGAQGVAITANTYVKVIKDNYKIYSGFNWSQKNLSKNVLNRTFLAKVKYTHANGSTYYSLYDVNNQWMGYINATGVKTQGVVAKTTLTTKYLDENNKSIKADSHVAAYVGDPFKVSAPSITGYVLTSAQTQSGTITQNKIVTFKYKNNSKPKQKSITVKYQTEMDIPGVGIVYGDLGDDSFEVSEGKNKIVTPPTFDGYALKTPGNITLTFNSPEVVQVIYVEVSVPDEDITAAEDLISQQLFEMINDLRTSQKVAARGTYDTLQSAVDKRAQEITSSFSHTRPDGTSCFTVQYEFSTNQLVTENIAYATESNFEELKASMASTLFNGWKNSSGHYTNMMNDSVTNGAIGVKITFSNGQYTVYAADLGSK